MGVFGIARVFMSGLLGCCLFSVFCRICQAETEADLEAEVEKIKANASAYPTPTQEQIRVLMPRLEQAVIENFSIEPGTAEAKYVSEMVLHKNIPKRPQAPGSKNPLMHYVFKEGRDLPSHAEIQEEQRKIQIALYDVKSDVETHVQEPSPEFPPQKFVPAPVITKPVCERSVTAALEIPEGYLTEGVKVDLLFFNGKPPFDIKTGIGKNTVLMPFGDPKLAEIMSPYASLDIDCVPFRLRSTGSKVIYSKGGQALKNYDANPDADGTFDPTVKKYIEQNNLGG